MTDAEDATDSYLLWELCKQQDIQRMILEDSADGKELVEFIEKVKQKYHEKNYSNGEKLDKLRELDSNPDYRSKILEESSWTKESVDVKDLGTTLPRTGDLPPEAISGSLPEVVKFVKEADPEDYRSVKYIASLKGFPEVLNEFLPWVVTPGNRVSKRDRMNRAHGENNWMIEDTWGMINDGNHRAIAKILANDSEEIKCYVGRRQN